MSLSIPLALSGNWKDVLLTPYGIKFSISFSYDINNILYIIYKNNSSNNNKNKSKVTQKRSKTKATLIQRQPRKHEWEKQRCLCFCCAGAAHKLKIRIYMQNLLEFQTFFASFIPVSCLLMYSVCVSVSRVCVDLCACICSAKLATTFDCECTHCLTRSSSAAALYPTPICSIQTTVVVAPLSALSHTVRVCLFLYSHIHLHFYASLSFAFALFLLLLLIFYLHWIYLWISLYTVVLLLLFLCNNLLQLNSKQLVIDAS